MFIPRYVMMNKAPFPIEVQEDRRPADPWVTIEQDECVPLWPKSKSDTCKMLRCKTKCDLNASNPFSYNEVQCSLLKLNSKVVFFLLITFPEQILIFVSLSTVVSVLMFKSPKGAFILHLWAIIQVMHQPLSLITQICQLVFGKKATLMNGKFLFSKHHLYS